MTQVCRSLVRQALPRVIGAPATLLVMRRLLLLLLSALLLPPTTTPVQAQVGAPWGTVVVAVAAASPPFAAQANSGQLVGFDLALMKTVARAVGLPASYEAAPFAQLLPGVTTRLYDAALGCIFVNEARKALVDFSVPYFTTGAVLVFVEVNPPLYALTDLTDAMRVSASAGSTAEALLRSQSQATVLAAASQQEALTMVATGVTDAALVDELAASRFMRTHPEARLQVASGLVTTDQCAIAVSKENPRLLLEINAALTRLQNNGKYLALYRRWFGDRPLTGPRPASTKAGVSRASPITAPTGFTPADAEHNTHAAPLTPTPLSDPVRN